MTVTLHEAIATYHDLLSDDIAAESQARLEAQLRHRDLYFGDRPLCTVLRPRFFTPELYRALQGAVRRVMRAFRRAHEAAMSDRGLREQFALLDWEERLVHCDPGFRDPSPASRLDAFFLGGEGLRFTEYNAETPAGSAYNDALSTVFYGLPIMRAFQRRYDARQIPSRHSVLQVLQDAFEQWSGRREPPRIAIVDWREVPTQGEFRLFRDYFRHQGMAAEIADPRELEYRNGRLMAGDFHITLVYKRVLLNELVAREGEGHPLLRAVSERAVCMVNPVQCKLLHKKTSLAVLSDERNAGLFGREERAAIEAHLPWTRRVEERKTVVRGREVDLVRYIVDHAEDLVLKPNDDYGGAGIVLGWEVGPDEWRRAVVRALAEPYIVQERVVLPFEPYPAMVDGRLTVEDRMLDTAPFVCYGEYAEGCLTRLSTAALLNVTAGGGSTVPTFLVDTR